MSDPAREVAYYSESQHRMVPVDELTIDELRDAVRRLFWDLQATRRDHSGLATLRRGEAHG